MIHTHTVEYFIVIKVLKHFIQYFSNELYIIFNFNIYLIMIIDEGD